VVPRAGSTSEVRILRARQHSTLRWHLGIQIIHSDDASNWFGRLIAVDRGAMQHDYERILEQLATCEDLARSASDESIRRKARELASEFRQLASQMRQGVCDCPVRWSRLCEQIFHVDTSKQVGDPDHLKVFAGQEAAKTWFKQQRSGRRRVRISCDRGRAHDPFPHAITDGGSTDAKILRARLTVSTEPPQ
jgi:hypothetical protein